jgi:broad specificity phosphatase PhoE
MTGVQDALSSVPGTVSVTFVGSFVDRDDVSAISDIDIIVVFDRLTPERFAASVDAVGRMSGSDLGFAGRTVRVNATLGPRKMDSPEDIVVHLMLYDLDSHRQHVLKSPFTCLDWERSELGWGTRLRDIYPVGRLGPQDFLSGRRGLADYLRDLDAGVMSYRRFEADGDRMIEVQDRMTLNPRHQGEYAYHIVRNLIANALKMLTGQNRLWDDVALQEEWARAMPGLITWIPFYLQLREAKLSPAHAFPDGAVRTTQGFLDAFSAWLDTQMASAIRARFVRHGETELNDGTFLGRGRDPGIQDASAVPAIGANWAAVYSSPLRRAVETARALTPAASIEVDDRLSEIDYGKAEGLTLAELRASFPEIPAAWERGEDAAFPEGEDNGSVLRRLRSFLATLNEASGEVLVVTHNVVLRTLAAELLGLDQRLAHRLPIAHLELMDVCRIGDRWLPCWPISVKTRLLDGYTSWPVHAQ